MSDRWSRGFASGWLGASLLALVLWLVLPGHASNGLLLPSAEHAPGYRNPDVRQATIHSTICVRGWTATVRPPRSYTDYVRRQELHDYRLPGALSDYTLDHLLSLELGGSGWDTRNLWLADKALAKRDDRLEDKWRAQVCAGELTLRGAQREEKSWKRLHG